MIGMTYQEIKAGKDAYKGFVAEVVYGFLNSRVYLNTSLCVPIRASFNVIDSIL
jgi:hypothetical protein